MSSVQWISVERSSSTRTETTITLGLCSATSPAHASTQWCGNKSRRPTGPKHPQELKVTLGCQLKWSTPQPDQVNIWEMPCGTPETPQDRWESFLFCVVAWNIIAQLNITTAIHLIRCVLCGMTPRTLAGKTSLPTGGIWLTDPKLDLLGELKASVTNLHNLC